MILSENFLKDTSGKTYNITPIIYLTSYDTDGTHIVNYAFSTDKIRIEVAAQGGYDSTDTSRFSNLHPIIKKISNVKSGIDYDSKKLKVNRMRFTLYNYYDVNNRFFDVANVSQWTSLEGLNVVLLYKTQSTNLVELPDPDVTSLRDNSCAVMFVGKITRITSTTDDINIQAEDSTVLTVTDKMIPYKKLSSMTSSNKTKLPSYSDKETIPMVYGDVDKAPCYAHQPKAASQDQEAHIIHDRHSLYGSFITNPIPIYLTNKRKVQDFYGSGYYYNYVYKKTDDLYMALDVYPTNTSPLSTGFGYLSEKACYYTDWNHSNTNSLAKTKYDLTKTWSNIDGANEFVFPDISGVSYGNAQTSKAECPFIKYIFPVSATGVYSRNINTTLDTLEHGANTFDSNSEYIYNYNGYQHEFYRWKDSITYKRNDDYKTHITSNYTYNYGTDNIIKARRLQNNRFTVITLPEKHRLINGHMDIRATKTNGHTNPNIADLFHPAQIRILPLDQDFFKFLCNNWGSSSEIIDAFVEQYGDYINTEYENWEDHPSFDDMNEFYFLMKWYILMNSTHLPLDRASSTISRFHTSFQGIDNYPQWFGNNSDYNYGGASGNDGTQAYGPITFSNYIDFATGNYGGNQDLYGEALEYTPVGVTKFETDKVLVIACPTGVMGREDLDLDEDGPIQLGYEIGQCAFTTHVRENIFEEVLYSSVTGRMIPLYSNPLQFFIDGFTTSSYWGYTLGTNNTNFRRLYNGPDEVRPSSWGDIFLDIYTQLGEHSLDWSYYQDWKQTYTNSGTPSSSYYSLQPDIHNILKPLDSFDYKPNPSLDDSSLYLNPFIVNKIFIPIWKEWMFYFLRILVNRDLNENGTYQDSFSQYLFDNDIQEFYETMSYSLFRSQIKFYLQYIFQLFYDTRTIDDELGMELWYDGFYSGAGANTGSWTNVDITGVEDLNHVLNKIDDGYLRDLSYFSLRDFINHFSGHCNESLYLAKTNESRPNIPERSEIDFVVTAAYRSERLGANMDQMNIQSSVIYLPSDIVMHILAYEVGYGIEGTPFGYGNNYPMLDPNKWDYNSIVKSREAHAGWEMGFAINEQVKTQEFIEEFLFETKSFMKFTAEGKLGFVTINNSYTNNDIDFTINSDDVINYKITKSKIEDVICRLDTRFRYDNGHERYIRGTANRFAKDYLPLYSEEYYNIPEESKQVDLDLRYITDNQTAIDFQLYHLLSNCNQHNIINIELPLSSILEIGSIIHIPLIENSKAFGMDYSVMNFINGQYVYPLWVVTDIDIGLESVKIQAYQLHYLDSGDNHGFVDSTGTQTIYGITQQYSPINFEDGTPIPIWNYNPYADTNILPNGSDANDNAISYMSFNNDTPNVVDIVDLVGIVLNELDVSESLLERFKYNSNGNIQDGYNRQTINVIDIINIVLAQE